jgi:hypothetical protein
MNTPTLKDVFDQLIQEQHLPESDREKITAALAGTSLDGPWFVQILSVVGAWIAAIMLFASALICVARTLDEPDEGSLIFFGIVLCVVAFAIRVSGPDVWSSDWGAAFTGTFAMVIAMVGQILIVTGVGISTESVNVALWVALILQGISLAFYPGRVLRFLSWITIAAILVYFIVDAQFEAGIYRLAVLLAAVTAYLWLRNPVLLGDRTVKDVIRTASYALPLSMFVLLLIPLLNTEFEDYSNRASDYHHPLIAAVGLLIIVVVLEAIQLRELDIRLQSRETLLLAASTAFVLAPSLRIRASWATSTVGARVSGSWSKVSRRARPNTSITRCITAPPSESSSAWWTRRRVSSASSPSVTSRRNIWRAASCSFGARSW